VGDDLLVLTAAPEAALIVELDYAEPDSAVVLNRRAANSLAMGLIRRNLFLRGRDNRRITPSIEVR
jgi:hypothetical protein